MGVVNAPTQTDTYAAGREASKDTSGRFCGDQMLREYGFVIHSRPGCGPAVWRRAGDGKLFGVGEARLLVLAARAKSLKNLERGK